MRSVIILVFLHISPAFSLPKNSRPITDSAAEHSVEKVQSPLNKRPFAMSRAASSVIPPRTTAKPPHPVTTPSSPTVHTGVQSTGEFITSKALPVHISSTDSPKKTDGSDQPTEPLIVTCAPYTDQFTSTALPENPSSTESPGTTYVSAQPETAVTNEFMTEAPSTAEFKTEAPSTTESTTSHPETTAELPLYSAWSSFEGDCSAPCGSCGLQTRTRTCLSGGCIEPMNESIRCGNNDLCFFPQPSCCQGNIKAIIGGKFVCVPVLQQY